MTTEITMGDPPIPGQWPSAMLTNGFPPSAGFGRIRIEWLGDSHDCDTCGWSSASGARVFLNDEMILELLPVAHCFGGDNWDSDDVYKLILEKLGFSVTEGAIPW